LKPGRLGLRARSGVIGLHLAGSVVQLAVPGERGDAVAEPVGSVENQVLALRFLQKRADDPAADAVTLTAGVDFDAGQVDLPRGGSRHLACRYRLAQR